MASRIIVDITVSIDGFVTGPNPGPENGLGDGGMPLHRWALDSDDPLDNEVLDDAVAATGAIVMGRTTFDIVDGPHGWSDERGYGAGRQPADRPPIFVLTHEPPPEHRLTDVHFVTDGPVRAAELAREAAGERDVYVMGGGATCRQFVEQGIADELLLHVSPILLGDGTPLFAAGAAQVQLEQLDVRVSRTATHARYRLSPA